MKQHLKNITFGQYLGQYNFQECHMDGVNREFHLNRISLNFGIRIKYEYTMASNSIRILNGVEMSC